MIGVFDSGIGGLTVMRALLRELPECGFVYLGDTARTPYGTKGPATIQRYAVEDARFLLDRGCQLIVVACNTVSATAMDALRSAFPTVPFVEVVTPAVAAAVDATRNGRIGVMGTRATVASGAYDDAIRQRAPSVEVVSAAAPLLVPLVEEGRLDHPVTRAVVREYLAPLLAADIDTLILGCTHYPLIEPIIRAVVGDAVTMVDSAAASAAAVRALLASDLALHRRCYGSARAFAVTDRTPHAEAVALEWLGMPVTFEVVELTGDSRFASDVVR